MIPIGLCSVVALAYTVERLLRLSAGSLGGRPFVRHLAQSVRERGPAGGLELCRAQRKPLARILGAGLARASGPYVEAERAAEDAGRREVKRLCVNLRPLVVVAMIAPLLGLLGTVWGMIQAFTAIANTDGLGKPEVLAGGISQALITTAAGLAVAIPTQALYYYFRARIDRFARLAEDAQLELGEILLGGSEAA
jgi:biopolymer transport protein ExbB